MPGPSATPAPVVDVTASDPTPDVIVTTRDAALDEVMGIEVYAGSPRDDELMELNEDLNRRYNRQTYDATIRLGKKNLDTAQRVTGLTTLVKKRNNRKKGL